VSSPVDPQPPAKPKAEAPRYTVDEIVENARALTGESPHAVRGALAGERAKTFTKDDATAKVRRFIGREVPTGEDG
jgi:hypothetical protein